MPRKVELRQAGKHFTVVDERGRVYARETNREEGELQWRRTIVGLGKEAGRKIDPKAKYSPKEREEMERLTRKAAPASGTRYARNYDKIDWSN